MCVLSIKQQFMCYYGIFRAILLKFTSAITHWTLSFINFKCLFVRECSTEVVIKSIPVTGVQLVFPVRMRRLHWNHAWLSSTHTLEKQITQLSSVTEFVLPHNHQQTLTEGFSVQENIWMTAAPHMLRYMRSFLPKQSNEAGKLLAFKQNRV